MDDDRLRAIEQRANAGEYHCREHWQQFDADDDVLFLLAIVARLRVLAPVDPAAPAVVSQVEDLRQAARILREWAGDRQRLQDKWTMREQVAVDLAIRLQSAAVVSPADLQLADRDRHIAALETECQQLEADREYNAELVETLRAQLNAALAAGPSGGPAPDLRALLAEAADRLERCIASSGSDKEFAALAVEQYRAALAAVPDRPAGAE